MNPSPLSRAGLALVTSWLALIPVSAIALSALLSDLEIHFPANYDAARAAKINVTLRNPAGCKSAG